MTIDLSELREYLIEYCGTAAYAGNGISAMAVLEEVKTASGEELCAIADNLGVSLELFVAD